MDNSYSYANVLEKLEMSVHGSNYTTLKKYIEEFQIDLTRMNENRDEYMRQHSREHGFIRETDMEQVLSGKRKYKGSRLREYLINNGLKERRCEVCGLSEWLGNPIPLNLHHKDGNHDNNRLDNLEIVCPNCHALTDNFAGKNTKRTKIVSKSEANNITKKGISEDGQRLYDGYGNYKILCPVCKKNFMTRNSTVCKECYERERKRPKISKEELYRLLDEIGSYAGIARHLNLNEDTISNWHKIYAAEDRKNGIAAIGSENAPSREVLKYEIRHYSLAEVGRKHGGVSGNIVKKWCKSYSLPGLKREINSISDDDWELV